LVIEPERHILDVWAIKLASGCNDAVAHSTNEEELRLFLHGTIIEAMEALHGIPRHSATAERNPLKGSRERYDNLYGGVAVEFEWDMGRARREHGADQALGYLSQLRKDIGDSEAFTTVVCDGKQWGFLSIDPQLDRTLFDTTPATKAEYFDWAPNDVSSCRRFLELIGSYRKRPVTNATLKSSFGPSSETTRLLVTLLVENLRGRAFDDRPDVLYKEWRRALDVVYGDLDHPDEKLEEVVAATYGLTSKGGVGESLFVLHTYFAFVTRLFAYEILGIATDDRTSRPSSWVAIPEVDLLERLTEMDQGILPGGLVIHNLFEPDVFSWWLDEARGSFDLVNAIREILSILSDFAFPRLVHGPQRATDVLSGLYQALVGKELRKKLGEFLTPRWLAEAGLNRLKESGAPLSEGRILDPTCGTGTFLIPILNDRLARLRSRNSSDSGNAAAVQDVLNTVAGIDINPVAVTATRVNIVLALGSLAGLGDLTLSVWRADSLLVPDAPPRQGRTTDGQLVGLSFRELRTSLPEPFPVPMLLGSAKRMEVLRRVLEHALVEETADLGVAYVRESLTERFGPDGTDVVTTDGPVWANEIEVAIVLFRQIRQLKDEGRDGVWSQIIANAYAPLFAGRFDVVVGNPPWLAWGRLPVQWRAGSEKLWRKYGLWKLPVEPGDTRGVFQVSDLCQLVFAIAIERYAVEQGWVGLLTPQSLLIANPGARAFRKCRLVSGEDFDGDPVDIPFDIVSVDDWSNLQPFAPLASNKPVFIVAHKGHDQQYPVTGHRWTRTVERTVVDGDWSNAKKSVTDTIGTYAPANPGVRTSAWSFRPDNSPDMLTGGENGWDFGIGLHTRGTASTSWT
jgi:SAM-dependent methyltransferase